MGVIEIILLGFGLSMDAAAIGMSDGLGEPKMKWRKMILIALVFGIFQGIFPLVGYSIGSIWAEKLSNVTPWLALILLTLIGGKMIFDGLSHEESEQKKLNVGTIFIQGVADSLDALSVGLIMITLPLYEVSLIVSWIAIITFILTLVAIIIGKKFGTLLSNKAEIVGGIILICIGLKIFIEYLIML